MRVVVTGGAGGLGSEVVRELVERGGDVVPASRRSGVDLRTGAGLAAALDGADVVVHAASNAVRHREVDLGGTRRLIEAARNRGGDLHLVYVSIVGCDANPFPYYRTKAACEDLLRSSGLPATVVRATQFHTLVAGLARAVRRFGAGVTVNGVSAQPGETGWVAGRLADVASGPAPDGFVRSVDLAGPERVSLADAIRLVGRHDGHGRTRVVSLPAVGAVARSFAAGTNLPGTRVAVGGTSFSDWLTGH